MPSGTTDEPDWTELPDEDVVDTVASRAELTPAELNMDGGVGQYSRLGPFAEVVAMQDLATSTRRGARSVRVAFAIVFFLPALALLIAVLREGFS